MEKTMEKQSPTCYTKRRRESSPAPNCSKQARLTSKTSFDSDDEDYTPQELNKIIGDRFDDLANFIEKELKRSNEKKCQDKKITDIRNSQMVIPEIEYVDNAYVKDMREKVTVLTEKLIGPLDNERSISSGISEEGILEHQLPTTSGNSVSSETMLTKNQQMSSPPRVKKRHAHSQNSEFILQMRHRSQSDDLRKTESTPNGQIGKKNSRTAVRKPKTLAKLRRTFQKKYANCFGIP